MNDITGRKIKIGDFAFCQDGITAKLDIRYDISSLEVANLTILLSQASVAMYGGNFVWIDFIKEKKLEKHFKITEKV